MIFSETLRGILELALHSPDFQLWLKMCIPVGLKLPMLHSWPILPLTSRPRPQPSRQQDSYVITPRPIRPNSSPRPSILLNPLGSIGSIRPCQSLWAAALSHPACVFLLLQPEHSVQMLLWDKDTTHKLYKETLCFRSCTATQPQPNDGRTCSLLVGTKWYLSKMQPERPHKIVWYCPIVPCKGPTGFSDILMSVTSMYY